MLYFKGPWTSFRMLFYMKRFSYVIRGVVWKMAWWYYCLRWYSLSCCSYYLFTYCSNLPSFALTSLCVYCLHMQCHLEKRRIYFKTWRFLLLCLEYNNNVLAITYTSDMIIRRHDWLPCVICITNQFISIVVVIVWLSDTQRENIFTILLLEVENEAIYLQIVNT